ncbi:hypothetical protein V8F33_013332 [Rhypophila sp. PSN 637]
MPLAECLQYSEFPLDVAVCMLLPEIVELLVTNGAELRLREDEVRMAIHFMGDTVEPFLWLYHGNGVGEAAKATVLALLRHGMELDAESEDGRTALPYIAAAPSSTVSVLESFLAFGPSCPEDLPQPATNSLQNDQVNSRKMALVLEYCANNLGQDVFMDQCLTAVEALVRHGCVEAAREVFRYGATWSDQSLLLPLPALTDKSELLHIAASFNHVGMMELLLEHGSATLDLDATGTPAATAADRGCREALDYLLRRGASVFTYPSKPEGGTILHEIISEDKSLHESERTLEYVFGIEQHKVRLSQVINNYDGRGFAALHIAIVWGSLVNVDRLL